MPTIINSLSVYLGYDFVRHALIAGSLAAILGAVVGYFVVMRKVSFAAHALSHVGFAGATGAVLLGVSPLFGMLFITVCAAIFMGFAGDKVDRSEFAIGMVLSICLGLGNLFLYLYTRFAGQTTALLFGNIFGVSESQIVTMVVLSLLSLGALALFSRKLLFASLQPEVAEARGISLTALAIAFMVVLAVSVTLASQVVGILLVFTLVIAPAGIALRMCRSFWAGILSSVFLGIAAVWIGILLACVTNLPVSFWITSLFFMLYLGVEGYSRLVRK